MIIHVNQIKFEGEDPWTTQMNVCSDLFSKWNDESLPEEDQKKYFQEWISERQRLELGMY